MCRGGGGGEECEQTGFRIEKKDFGVCVNAKFLCTLTKTLTLESVHLLKADACHCDTRVHCCIQHIIVWEYIVMYKNLRKMLI